MAAANESGDNFWRSAINEAFEAVGDLPEAPQPVVSPEIVEEAIQQVQEARTKAERFSALVEELYDRQVGVPIFAIYKDMVGGGEEDDEEARSEMTIEECELEGYVLPSDNQPKQVVALFPDGHFYVLRPPKSEEGRQKFQANFMPGMGAFVISASETKAPIERFLLEASYDPDQLLRSEKPGHEAEAWQILDHALNNADVLRDERLATQERQAQRLGEAQLRMLDVDKPGPQTAE